MARLALEGRWWRWRVVLRATDIAALAEVPGARDDALTLWIARGDRAVAAELITNLEIQQADAALAAAEEPRRCRPRPPDRRLPGGAGGPIFAGTLKTRSGSWVDSSVPSSPGTWSSCARCL